MLPLPNEDLSSTLVVRARQALPPPDNPAFLERDCKNTKQDSTLQRSHRAAALLHRHCAQEHRGNNSTQEDKMDANTPAWLRDNTVEASSAPSAPVPDSNGVISSVPPPVATAVAATADGDDNDPDLPGVILTMRLANIGVSIAMIVTSVRIYRMSVGFSVKNIVGIVPSHEYWYPLRSPSLKYSTCDNAMLDFCFAVLFRIQPFGLGHLRILWQSLDLLP
jgi:hypothetical protein